nr:endonuclease [bacterium]
MLKLSASSMGTYDKCPKKYHYRYIEKPDIEVKEWIHLEFGSCAHRALELFHMDLCENIRRPEEYPVIMRESFKRALKEFNLKLLKPELPYLREILQDYLDGIKKNGLPQVVATELPFNFMVGDYMVRGIIDRIDKVGPGEYHVVDYKTSKSDKYLTDFQLVLYALAVQDIYPDAKIVHGSYCMLKHKSSLKGWTFSEEDYVKAQERVLNLGTSISLDTVWQKKPTFLCGWCDYKTICQNSWAD